VIDFHSGGQGSENVEFLNPDKRVIHYEIFSTCEYFLVPMCNFQIKNMADISPLKLCIRGKIHFKQSQEEKIFERHPQNILVSTNQVCHQHQVTPPCREVPPHPAVPWHPSYHPNTTFPLDE